jgi:hypothetical protein
MWGDCRVTSELFEYETNLGARADWPLGACELEFARSSGKKAQDAQS